MNFRPPVSRPPTPRSDGGFILGELRVVHSSRYGKRDQPTQQSPARQVFVDERLNAELRGSYRNAFSAASTIVGGRRIIWIYVERSPGDFTTAVDAAVIPTTRDHIPADSSYERRMADAPVAAGRSFVKPLTFDAVTDVVLPDSVLTDEPNTQIEVGSARAGRATSDIRPKSPPATGVPVPG